MTSYALLMGLVTINILVGFFGSKAGYTVNGVVQGQAYEATNPGTFGVVEWVWEGLQFIWNMVTFQIDGMPELIALAFILMQVGIIFIVLKLIRGTD